MVGGGIPGVSTGDGVVVTFVMFSDVLHPTVLGFDWQIC